MRAAAAALALVLAACAEEQTSHIPKPKAASGVVAPFTPPPGFTKLRIGLVPYANPADLQAAHAPLAGWLSAQLHVPVEVVMGDTYDDAAARLERGEVDVVEFSPYAYVRAEKRLALRPLVTAISDGSETAAGYVFVRADSPRKTLADLNGASFGFVDPASTSGYLYPMKLFKDQGVVLAKTEFFGNHENVLLAVHEGKVDAGATYQGSLAALRRTKNVDPLNFRIIAKTPRTPRDLFCVRADFPAELGDALVRIFTSISGRTPGGRQVLGPINMNGFFPADDRLYDGVRAAAATVDAK